MSRFEKILSVVCLVTLAAFAVGCAVDGAVEGKAAGKASTSPSVFPWAGTDSKPAAAK